MFQAGFILIENQFLILEFNLANFKILKVDNNAVPKSKQHV